MDVHVRSQWLGGQHRARCTLPANHRMKVPQSVPLHPATHAITVLENAIQAAQRVVALQRSAPGLPREPKGAFTRAGRERRIHNMRILPRDPCGYRCHCSLVANAQRADAAVLLVVLGTRIEPTPMVATQC